MKPKLIIKHCNYKKIRQSPNDYQLLGMRRCGNHIIIHWIFGYLNNGKHYNNCCIKTEPNGQGMVGTLYCDSIISYGNGDSKTRLLSFEDQFLDYINGVISSKIRIIIIRDPFNLYASRARSHELFPELWVNEMYDRHHRINKQIALWKQYAKEYLKITNLLNTDNLICINYNKWFCDIDYRNNIGKIFGNVNSSDINFVPNFAGGSSFDFLEYRNRGSQMDVLGRWKTCKNHEDFIKILEDDELMNLAKAIFHDNKDQLPI